MSTIRVAIQLHNPAIEPREIRRDFNIDRDLKADPIEPGEVLHLGPGIVADLIVSTVLGGEPYTVVSLISQPGMNVDARVNEAATDGWTVAR